MVDRTVLGGDVSETEGDETSETLTPDDQLSLDYLDVTYNFK